MADPFDIRFNGVSYAAVSGGAPAKRVLNNVSFTVDPGQTLVLLGRSGSGKTTALRLINGMLTPSAGRIVVGGKEISTWDLIDLRRRTGYVIQESGLFPHFTVEKNVALVPTLLRWPGEKAAARARELLEQVGLPPADFGHRLPRELSGGQRQRVGVARALAANPALMLLDEPFGALDPVTRLELQRQFLTLRAQTHFTSVFVTHDIREALKLGTRIALLHQGTLEFFGAPEDFLKSEGSEARRFREVLA